ncbi:unnamed protein product [Oppiella nova]|uniref:Down syndrome cell adhesion molecule-like protein Dscam2 n=1 Tax=Oppiella nova TaxID=334625 RepID=A0A7R9LQU9_9ACAR|nr:unnamed protein product [Oppiella nova]CAG2165379.1 unnamed protein product [Oppiella nova]
MVLQNGQTLKTSPEANYNIENSKKFSILSIDAITRSDSANYTCLVRNAFGSDKQSVLLSIKAPKLGSIVSHKSLSIGSSFQVFCNVEKGSLPVFFEWSRNGQTLKTSPDANYKIENFKKFSTLSIDEITRSDSANYSCLVRNAVGSDTQSVLLSIKAPKLGSSGISHKSLSLGSNFQIFCNVETGSLPVFFEWSRNGQTLKPSPDANYKIENSKMFSAFTIETIDRRDSANYSCVVRNAFGADTQSVLLSIKGSNFQIFCNVETGSLPVFFEWSRNGQTLKTSPDANYKIGNFKMHSTFTIEKINRRDSANYSCVVRNAFGTDSQSVLLSIKAPKLGFSGVSQKSQSIGTHFSVFCTVETGSLPVFFEWSRNGQTLKASPDVNYKIENSKKFSTFSIDAIDRRDAANYTCLVRNAFGTDSQSVLLLIKAPKLGSGITQKSQSIGTHFSVFCTVESGSLPVFFEWSRNGQTLKPSPDVSYKIDNSKMFSTFTIEKIDRKDSANYTCLVRNAFGTDTQSVLLLIKAPKLAFSGVSQKTQSIGSHFQIFCTVETGSLPVFFEWSRNGQTLKPSPDVNYKIENFDRFSTFMISKIVRQDSGNYSCFVRNAFGSDSQNVLLTIKVPKLSKQSSHKNQTEGSYFQLFCSVQKGLNPFFFEWFRDGHQLRQSDPQVNHQIDNFDRYSTLTIESIVSSDAGNYSCLVRNAFGTDSQFVVLTIEDVKSNPNYKVETSDELSILSIASVFRSDSANYSCFVSNTYGTDSQTVVLNVKVPPTWLKEPQDIRVKAGDDVVVECIADGFTQILMKTLSPIDLVKGAEPTSLASYKPTFVRYYTTSSHNGYLTDLDGRKVTEGEVLNLSNFKTGSSETYECIADNAEFTLQRPLVGDPIKWTKDNIKLDKLGTNNYEIFETTTDFGVSSELLLRTTQRTDGSIYKCEAENTHGKDERTIKLVVLEVPGPPTNVHVKEVWSRTARIVWSAPYSGNSPLTKYTIQYWRHQSAPHRLHEFTASSTQTTALIKDLSPGLSYEMTVVGENEVGRGEAADTVTFVTGEEEPSAPGLLHRQLSFPGCWYAQCTSRGGRLVTLPRYVQNSKNAETEIYEYFVRDLSKGTEYAIVVKAYNSAGSGPQSHEMLAHTYDGDLPPAQQLNAIESTGSSISVRWHQKDLRESQTPTTSYTLHYKKEGEPKWKEIPLTQLTTPTPMTDASTFSTYTYNFKVIQNEILNQFFNDGPYYLQPSFTIPLLSAAVIIIIVIIFAFVCVRRIRSRAAAEGCEYQHYLSRWEVFVKRPICRCRGAIYLKLFWSRFGMMLSEDGNAYPTPYATMPMGQGDGSQKPWERPLSHHSMMKKDHHIYDHPQ